MFTWRSLRLFFGVLLCLPVLHVAWLIADELRAYLDPSPRIWSDNMAAIMDADQHLSLPDKPILIVGGRSVTLWQGLEDLLKPHTTLRRGLGDATIEDIIHYYDRLIGYYRPAVLVLLPSYGDLHLRDNKTPERFLQAITELTEVNNHYLPTTPVYIFMPVKTLLHRGDDAKINAITRLLDDWATGQPLVTVLNGNAMLQQEDGRPAPRFYRGDGVNLNADGYLRLATMLRRQLTQSGGA